MTSTEIRQVSAVAYEQLMECDRSQEVFLTGRAQMQFLAEIAAQLAEINERAERQEKLR